jgi:hypothetical protein
MSIFSHFSHVTLTGDQRAALAALEGFMNDPEKQVFILRGYAGTGKTFLMEGVAAWLQSLSRSVLFTAPTGRAAKVLQNRTGKTTHTIHRAIYSLESSSEDTGATAFRLANREAEPDAHWVFVVDEASMLGDNTEGESTGLSFGSGRLLNDYIRYADFRQYPHTKLVLVGDNAQLPPVGMDFSPALSADYIALEYRLQVAEAELRDVVRQESDSDLLRSATGLRSALAERKLTTRLPIKSGNGLRIVPAEKLTEKYLEFNPDKPSGQQVIIAHSNTEVTAYNQLIRQHYFPGKAGVLAAGDILVISQNAYHTTPSLHNGEIVRVESVGALEVRHIKAPRGRIYPCNVPFIRFGSDVIEGEFHFREATLSVRTADGGVARVQTKVLENWLDCAESTFPFAAQHLLRRDAMDRFYQANKHLYATDKEQFERLRSQFVAIDPWCNALRCRFGYAITCHKAQGGEWKYVFVDMRASMSRDSEEFYRWVYTSITRAKRCVWLAFNSGEPKSERPAPVRVQPVVNRSRSQAVVSRVLQKRGYEVL